MRISWSVVGHLERLRKVGMFWSARERNRRAVEKSWRKRSPVVNGMPTTLMLEPTNACNLNCPLCPTGSGATDVPKGYMAFELFERVVSELHPYLFATNLWGFGEPMLHPRLPAMVTYLEGKNVPAEVSTNGTHLLKDSSIEKLLDSGLSRLRVSLDGASQDVYEQYRKGGSLKKIVGAIERIQQFKAQRKLSKPWLAIQFIVMRQNEHEIEGMKRLARELGVDLRLKAVAVCEEHRAEYLPVESEIVRYGRDDDAERQSALCRFPWDTLTVNWDGTVVPCCKDPHRCHLIGKIDEHTSASEIWNGEAFVSFRERRVTEKHALEECATCALPVKEKIPLAKNT